jgi:hypothetical protein
MQKQQARLRCDCDPDLFSENESAASFEIFLVEKHLDVAQQFLFVFGRQSIEQIEVPLEYLNPLGRSFLVPQLFSSAIREKT